MPGACYISSLHKGDMIGGIGDNNNGIEVSDQHNNGDNMPGARYVSSFHNKKI